MEHTISFIYSPWIYFNSYKNVLKNVRLYYPKSDIFIFFDRNRNDIQQYLDIACKYNCFFIIRENEVGYINRSDTMEVNLPKQYEWVKRMRLACSLTESDWMMHLEDDVLIKRQILNWPSADCGKNREDGFLGGGSIFKRLKCIEAIDSSNIEECIKSDHTASWAGDHLFKVLFGNINASSEKWIELAEPEYYDETDHAVYHGYKELHKTND